MKRRRAVTVAALVVLAMAVVPLIGVAATAQPAPATAQNGTNATVAPGQQLGAVVDVGQAELETDVEGRAFGQALSAADSPEAKARIVKQRLETLDRDVEALDDRLADLRTARENGSLSEGAYQARVTGVAAQIRGKASLANGTGNASAGLTRDVLEANGVEVDTIEQLRQRASDLGGEEVSQIARDIAGPGVGTPPGRPSGVPAPPVSPAGPPDGVGSGTGNGTAAGPGTDGSGR